MSEQASQDQGQAAPPEKETDNTTVEGQVAAPAPPNPAASAATPAVVTPSGKKGEFTQSDLNKAAGRARDEGRKVGSQELLSELGVDSPDTLRQIIQERQEAEEAKRTEAEKMQKQFEKEQKRASQLEEQLSTTLTKAQQVALQSQARLQALEQQVKPERVNAVLKLADLSEVGVNENFEADPEAVSKVIAGVLDEYPEFAAQAPRRVGSSSNPATEPPSAGPKTAWEMAPEEFERFAQEAKWGTHQVNPFR